MGFSNIGTTQIDVQSGLSSVDVKENGTGNIDLLNNSLDIENNLSMNKTAIEDRASKFSTVFIGRHSLMAGLI